MSALASKMAMPMFGRAVDGAEITGTQCSSIARVMVSTRTGDRRRERSPLGMGMSANGKALPNLRPAS